MAPLGPWPAARRIAIAVSGGADSLALAVLARDWGEPSAFIVDHRLRPGSAAEACAAAATLASLGIPAHILTIAGLHPGPALQARARAARYATLTQACRENGLTDLLLGHHAADQAETLLLRAADGSAAQGLAAMATIAERQDLRLVRPLLGVSPARLKATLERRGIAWAEDPSNTNPAFTRTLIRAALSKPENPGPALLQRSRAHAIARAIQERETAAFLAENAEIHPEGYALLAPEDVPPAALAALIRGLAGALYAPAGAALARLSRRDAVGTIGGMRLMRAGRLGPGRLLVREIAALSPPVPLRDGALWDRRFRAGAAANQAPQAPPGATIGAVGRDSARLRRLSPLPAAILSTLPAMRDASGNLAVPHVPALKEWTNPPFKLRLAAMAPVAGAPFHGLQTPD
jgi:tRNA(Ile)-lysidine synthase